VKNITLAIDEEVLDKARVVAARRRATVNAMVRDFLTKIAASDQKRARRDLLLPMRTSEGRMAPNAKFSREDSHER